jgi:hypothetical protein
MRIFDRLACALVATSCIAVFPARGLAAQRTPTKAGQPALVDRELFFGDPEIAAARLSPDGRFIAFLKPFRGTRNIWVKGVNDPSTRLVPSRPRRVARFPAISGAATASSFCSRRIRAATKTSTSTR